MPNKLTPPEFHRLLRRAAQPSVVGEPTATLMNALERLQREFLVPEYDKDLSYFIIEKLSSDIEGDKLKDLLQELTAFVETNKQKLAQKYEEYKELRAQYPLLFQPEAILVFHGLASHPRTLIRSWRNSMPYDDLERLSAIWGIPVPEVS